ncbi:MAG: hypothetical protein AAF593_00345 [Planctomycetota bacterium]
MNFDRRLSNLERSADMGRDEAQPVSIRVPAGEHDLGPLPVLMGCSPGFSIHERREVEGTNREERLSAWSRRHEVPIDERPPAPPPLDVPIVHGLLDRHGVYVGPQFHRNAPAWVYDRAEELFATTAGDDDSDELYPDGGDDAA